jgi:cytochrome c biogenesis protein CcmG, thiol:disulfide interchange protein DsbE
MREPPGRPAADGRGDAALAQPPDVERGERQAERGERPRNSPDPDVLSVLLRLRTSTALVVLVLAALLAGYYTWARLSGTAGGGLGFSALDAILAARADRFVAQPAPTFTLRDADGELVSLEDLRGRVVLINFWATWCEPCRAEMPELDRAARAYHDAGFRVLAVNLLEDAAAIQKYGRQLDLGIPLLVDPSGEVSQAYSVQGLPASFLVDRQGVIRDVHLGVLTPAYLDGKVSRLLDAAPSS